MSLKVIAMEEGREEEEEEDKGKKFFLLFFIKIFFSVDQTQGSHVRIRLC